MIASASEHSSLYCCEQCEEVATNDKRVLRITLTDGSYVYRCATCLWDTIKYNASVFASSAGSDCSNCGASIDVKIDSVYCWDCSVDSDSTHDECVGSEDVCSCHNCGDQSHFCSADCAVAEQSLSCNECGGEIPEPNLCLAHRTTTGRTFLVTAASNVELPENVSEAGDVTVDDVEFRFG